MRDVLKRTEFWIVPALTLLVHLVTWHGYGWFRDEFYYVVCARHLAWGYVDHPPLSIAVLRLVIGAFGESLQVIRAVPALAHAVTVLLSGLIVRELQGGRFAALLAMVSAATAPMVLSLSFFYSMNALDVALWSGAALAVLVALRTERDRAWAWGGLWLGLGLLNKVSVLWLGGGIVVALVLTSYRRVILRRGVWIAAGVATVLFVPHIVWQIQHLWPTLEFMRQAGANKMVARSALAFTGAAIADQGPVVALMGIVGLVAAFSRWVDPRARVLAWVFIAVLLVLALNGTSRTGYLAPAWLLVGAVGAMSIERRLASRGVAARVAALAVPALLGAATLPLAVPVLSTESFVRYAARLGQKPSSEEKKDVGRLPNFFADMNGWTSIVSSVEAAWRRLPEADQARAVFYGSNYGEAGALDVLGRASGMRPAVSGHNNYFLWGPPSDEINAVVVMTSNPTRWAGYFEHVEQVGETACGDCMPYENTRPIYIAWGRRMSWATIWPALKHFD